MLLLIVLIYIIKKENIFSLVSHTSYFYLILILIVENVKDLVVKRILLTVSIIKTHFLVIALILR